MRRNKKWTIKDKCMIKKCERPVHVRGLCRVHYDHLVEGRTIAHIMKNRRGKNKAAPCSIVGCDKAAHCRGMCATHYQIECRNRNSTGFTCSVPGCEQPHRSRGLCAMHYEVWYDNSKLCEVKFANGPDENDEAA